MATFNRSANRATETAPPEEGSMAARGPQDPGTGCGPTRGDATNLHPLRRQAMAAQTPERFNAAVVRQDVVRRIAGRCTFGDSIPAI